MKPNGFRLFSTVLFTTCLSLTSISAGVWQVPNQAIICSAELGKIQVFHDDDEGWFIVDNKNRTIQLEDYFVDREIRFLENEDLEKLLGLCQFDIAKFDTETNEVLEAYQVQTRGYLGITTTTDGAYIIRFNMRLQGGGWGLGICIGLGIKALGYTVVAIYGGPVGWAIAANGIKDTVKSGIVSFGVGKAAKILTGAGQLKNLSKATKAVRKAEKAVSKCRTAKKLVDAKRALAAAQATLKQVQAANAAGKAAALGDKAYGIGSGVQSAADLGKKAPEVARKATELGIKAAINPAVAAIDLVADIGQTIGDFVPGF
jgi:hypothetical protein